MDAKQTDVEAHFGLKFEIPVLFLTQLMGLAFGLTPKEIGLDKNFVPPHRILNTEGRFVEAVVAFK